MENPTVVFRCKNCNQIKTIEYNVYDVQKEAGKDEYFVTVKCPFCGTKQDVKVIYVS